MKRRTGDEKANKEMKERTRDEKANKEDGRLEVKGEAGGESLVPNQPNTVINHVS